jgi:hypothetical protein
VLKDRLFPFSQGMFSQTSKRLLLHDRHTIHTAFKEKHPSVHHDRDVPGDESDDDEPLDPIGLVLKHTGRVPFSKLESKNLTVSEGDHVATYFHDRDLTHGKGPQSPGWAWGRVKKSTGPVGARQVTL